MNRNGWTLAVGLSLLVIGDPVLAQHPTAVDRVLTTQVGFGAHAPNLSWTLGGVGAPRSRLSYEKVRSLEASAIGAYQLSIWNGWNAAVTAGIRGGPLVSGVAQDSDFSFRDRTEYSRSISDITGDVSVRLEIGLGVVREVRAVRVLDQVELWAGWARHQVTFRKQNGEQVIPADASSRMLDGLDSRYRARWDGPWVGGGMTVPVGLGHLRLMAKQHFRSSYSAEGEWNLREDLMQPVSFSQGALGSGYDLVASFGMPVRVGMHVMIETGLSSRGATNGHDIEFLATGETIRGNLGEVNARDLAVRALLTFSR